MSLIDEDDPPYIFVAIMERRWSDAIKLLGNFDKDESKFIGVDRVQRKGWTALHWACYHHDTPLEVIRLLLCAWVKAAIVKDEYGNTPLHYAVRNSLVDSISLLVECCKGSIYIQNRLGRTPLHFALSLFIDKDGRLAAVTKTLVESDPSMVLVPNDYGVTPISRFFATWNQRLDPLMRKPCNSLFLLDCVVTPDGVKVKEIHDIILLLLRAADLGTTEEYDKNIVPQFCPLHVCLKLKSSPCPRSFFRMFSKLYPEQILKEDDDGNMLIHLIASSGDDWSTTIGADVLNDLVTYACIPNQQGRLPLHISLHSGANFKPGSLPEIFFLNAPFALRTSDMRTHMMPFMIAALRQRRNVSVEESSLFCLSQFTSIFHLLLEDPTLVSTGVS